MIDSPRPDSIKSELRALLGAIAERARAERQIDAEFADDGSTDLELSKTLRSIKARYESDQQAIQNEYESKKNDILAQFQRDDAAIRADYQAALVEIERQFGTESQAAEKEKADATWMVSSVLDDASHESPRFQFETFRKRLMTSRDRLQEQRREIDETLEAIDDVMHRRRQMPRSFELDPVTTPDDLTECEERFADLYRKIRDGKTALVKQKLSRLFGGVVPALLFLAGCAAIAVPLINFVDPLVFKIDAFKDHTTWLLVAIGASAIVMLIVMATLLGISRSKSIDVFLDAQQAAAELKAVHKRWAEAAKQELHDRKRQFERRYREIVAQRDRSLANIEAKAAARLAAANERKQQERAEADQKYPALLDEIARTRDKQFAAIDDDFQEKSAKAMAEKNQATEAARHKTGKATADRKSSEGQARSALAAKWRAGTSKFLEFVSGLDQQCRRVTHDWSSLLNNGWTLPDQVLAPIRVGRYDLDFSKIPDGLPQDKNLWPDPTRVPVPFALPFPSPRGSLLFESQGEGRGAAVEAMRTIMLRLLTSVPGGKLRFTVIDPVGLGEEFSVFMNLADFDELIIGTRIWTEKSQIEKRLTDLSEHMENVFQAYLRNEFESIEEYNEQAGEVAEPYQFLVVANFPANFSDSAAQRLVSIATSGPRCGVYTLISVDTKQALPHGFDLADLEAAATTLDWQNGRFVARDPDLAPYPVKLDSPPRAADFAEIVKTVGRLSKDARRVEVAFERIAPRRGDLWRQDSRTGLDVPLGRAGATKLQHLRLGKGTSQHVMIAGKTGSGKSSLLHTLICNLALHYSPDEVQFFLVDFKKGVEFKTYASHSLPHARIIGIESDREFGISVLERLDRVLVERGEKFREVGAQDVQSYRRARPNERLPRILLIVDEFQEFFVEDDALSASANLLLDRLVRQGRAFGIHVLLGSQTLGGAYSLARSTLGQVAVRIALQCSESDAHLILSEENAAARLLTRPGEAIYNDSNGLVEGNHPFQIAWLPDDKRDDYLKQVEEIATAQNVKVTPAIVFEGNIPSDPRNNQDVVNTISGFHALASSENGRPHEGFLVWLGEPVSIKPPSPIRFNRRPGDNLIIVGQDTQAAHGMLAVSFLTLAAQLKVVEPSESSTAPAPTSAPAADFDFTSPAAPAAATFYVLDGDAVDANSVGDWQRLTALVPHRVVRAGQREAASAVQEVASEVTRRIEQGTGDEPPIFVFISNLSRLRELRNEQDDFGFSSSMDESKGVSAGKLLADIFRDGPAVGVHAIVWCDTYSNLNRWITQQSLREFELRVAFQMNSADSSSLIDSPYAARLGTHRALLYLRETGKNEKLRPYAVPSNDWLTWISAQFR